MDVRQPLAAAKPHDETLSFNRCQRHIKFFNLKQKYKEGDLNASLGSDQYEFPLFHCQRGGNSLASNESGGSVSGTLAIHTLVLP